MTLHPHLHLLIPSSDPSILLETRLYLPPIDPTSPNISPSLSVSTRSTPRQLTALSPAVHDELKELGIGRVVVAAHPWGKLGGNMLDPVLSSHLIDATFSPLDNRPPTLQSSAASANDTPTAVVTYNVRGVGASQGSSAWVTPGNDPMDFAAVEQWAVDALRPVVKPTMDVYRLGYSWGCIAAVLAPLPSDTNSHRVQSIMLVSPPLSFLPAVTYFSGSFDRVLRSLVASSGDGSSNTDSAHRGEGTKVWTIYGDNDQITGVAKYRSWVQGIAELKAKEVEGDHFWRGDRQGEELEAWMREWLAQGLAG